MKLGMGLQHYAVVGFRAALHLPIFSKEAKLHAIVSSAEVPRSLDGWIQLVRSIARVACVGKTTEESYSFKWCIRSYLVAERHARGDGLLRFASTDKVKDFSQAFPDQCSWVKQLGYSMDTSIGCMVRGLGYKDSLEMLSVDLCSFGFLRGWSADVLKGKTSQLRKTFRALQDETGHMPHPVVVVSSVMKDVGM